MRSTRPRTPHGSDSLYPVWPNKTSNHAHAFMPSLTHSLTHSLTPFASGTVLVVCGSPDRSNVWAFPDASTPQKVHGTSAVVAPATPNRARSDNMLLHQWVHVLQWHKVTVSQSSCRSIVFLRTSSISEFIDWSSDTECRLQGSCVVPSCGALARC
jgi:hypothetical protein